MRKIHPPHEVDNEMDTLRLSLETEIAEEGRIQDAIGLKLFALRGKGVCGKLFAVVGCLVAQHLIGFNLVMYHSPPIVAHLVGHDSSKLILMLLRTPVLSAIGLFLCTALVDRYGRRRLLLVSTFGIIACLGFGSYLFNDGGTGDDMISARRYHECNKAEDFLLCISTSEEERRPTGLFGYLALVALGLYFIFYSLGIGTIPWIINSEIYPLRYRNPCGSLAALTYWLSKMIVGTVFDDFGSRPYYIARTSLPSTLFSCAVWLFIYFYIPETKGFRIEEIEKKLLLQQQQLKKQRNHHQLKKY